MSQEHYSSLFTGYGKIIELLIQHGVNIHAQDPSSEKTALHLAIDNGNTNHSSSMGASIVCIQC